MVGGEIQSCWNVGVMIVSSNNYEDPFLTTAPIASGAQINSQITLF